MGPGGVKAEQGDIFGYKRSIVGSGDVSDDEDFDLREVADDDDDEDYNGRPNSRSAKGRSGAKGRSNKGKSRAKGKAKGRGRGRQRSSKAARAAAASKQPATDPRAHQFYQQAFTSFVDHYANSSGKPYTCPGCLKGFTYPKRFEGHLRQNSCKRVPPEKLARLDEELNKARDLAALNGVELPMTVFAPPTEQHRRAPAAASAAVAAANVGY